MIQIAEHQNKVTEHLLYDCTKQDGMVIFHKPGTGKTFTILNLIQKYKSYTKNKIEVTIVCFIQVAKIWKQEMKKINMNTTNITFTFLEYTEFLKRKIENNNFKNSFLIIDECHHIIPMLQEEQYLDCFYSNCRKYEKKMFLSGTPIVSSAFDIFHFINACSNKIIFPTNDVLFNKEFKKKKWIKGVSLMLLKTIIQVTDVCISEVVMFLLYISIVLLSYKNIPLAENIIHNFNLKSVMKILQPFLNIIRIVLQVWEIILVRFIIYLWPHVQKLITKINIFKFEVQEVKEWEDIKYLYKNGHDLNFEDIKKRADIFTRYVKPTMIVLIYLLNLLIINPYYINSRRINDYYELNKKKIVKYSQKYISYVDIPITLQQRFPTITERIIRHSYTSKQMNFFLKFIKGNLTKEDCLQLDLSDYKVKYKNLLETPESIYNYGCRIGNLYDTKKFEFILQNILSNPKDKIAIYSNYHAKGGKALSTFLQKHNVEHLYLVNTEDVSLFNEGNIRIIILHPKFSESLTLLKVRHFHILEIPSTISKLEQIKARINRLDSHKTLSSHEQNCIIYTHIMTANQALKKLFGFYRWVKDKDFWRSSFWEQHLYSIHDFQYTPDQIVLHEIESNISLRNNILKTIKQYTIENMTADDYKELCDTEII